MKRIISIILKTILLIVFNAGVFFVISFILDNMDSLTIGSLSFDIKDWWYEQSNYHMIAFVMVTALFSGILYLVYSIVNTFIRNKVILVIGILADIVLLVSLNHVYWIYVWSLCPINDCDWSPLGSALTASYGTQQFAICLYDVCILIVLLVGKITKYSYLLIGNSRNKVVSKQVFLNSSVCDGFLFFGIPYMIVMSAMNFLVGFLGLKVVSLYLVISGTVIFYSLFIHVLKAYRLNNYYKSIELDNEKKEHLVLFQESDRVKHSYVVQLLYGNGIKHLMKNSNVWLYPLELGVLSDVFVKLDFYDEWFFLKKKEKQERIVQKLTDTRGTFNLAYNLDTKIDAMYDVCYSSMDNLRDAFVVYDEYLSFKNKVMKELKRIDLSILNKASCISEEIEEFKYYLLDQTTNQFIVFDLLIKWLEIMNYFFAMSALSASGISACELIESGNKINYADFKKWRDIFEELTSTNELNNQVNNYVISKATFETFDTLWHILVARSYDFKAYSVQELLEACNSLRDYTRGHGVFTFEISQEINLSLLKLFVALADCLFHFQKAIGMMDNLEDLGWIIYSGDIPYFLYSIDKRNGEGIYESFRKGNSLSLPIDIYGDFDEE